MTEDVFDAGMKRFGLAVSPDAKRRMEAFLHILLEKNKVMNLTAVKDRDEAVSRHLVDSLAVLKAAGLCGKKIIDVGCGAGFPGMPLKLYDLSYDITLLDSQKKRIDFLGEACAVLGVAPRLICARAEEAACTASLRGQFDLAVARAVAPLNMLCELSMPFLKTGGLFLAMKMRDSGEELQNAERAIKLLNGEVSGFFDYTLPLTEAGYRIVRIRKTGDTPPAYPRRFSKIKSQPL